MKMKLVIFTLFFMLVFLFPTVNAEALASVRYLTVEEISYLPSYQYGEDINGNPLTTQATHFAYTYALWKVNAWSDRAYYIAYVVRDKIPVVVAKWSVGFSVTGGLQGIFIDSATDLLTVETIMAEFPYKTETVTNAIDGTQAYKFYRMHFYFKGELFKGETVTVAADYMKQPTDPTATMLNSIVPLAVDSGTGSSTNLRILRDNHAGGQLKFREITK